MTDTLKTEKIISFIKNVNILDVLILALAIISANFAAYISYFDLNSLAIVDSSSIARHILGLTIPFVLASATVTVLLTIIQYYLSTKTELSSTGIEITLHRSFRETVHSLLGNRMTKFIISVTLFCVFYLGLIGTLLVVFFFLVYFIMIAYLNNIFESELIEQKEYPTKEPINIEVDEDAPLGKKLFSLKIFGIQLDNLDQVFNYTASSFTQSISDLSKGTYLKFLASKVGVMLIFLALALGFGRAHFVNTNVHVNVNGGTEVFVLFMTTSSGLALFNPIKRQVSFTSWDGVNNIEFIKEKRRSIESGFFVSPSNF